ncbi:MAG: ABC transporter substrate-binding protein [Hydrogenophaga sp.]|nr:ABC transporter substrate-binding protein [Hydrogenophaga sp.]
MTVPRVAPAIRSALPRVSRHGFAGRFWGLLRAWARGRLAMLAIGGLLSVAGCGEPPQAPLTVGLNSWVGYDPLVLARERGLVDPARVKVVELSTHAESFRHFRNGLLDALTLTLDQALQLADDGLDVKIIAVLDESAGSDVVMGALPPGGPDRWRGQRVAVEPSTLGRMVLHHMLASQGLSDADVTVVPLAASQHLAALQAGRVAAAVTYEPWASQMRKAGFSPAFDSRQMPGEIVDVLVVRGSVLANRPADVDALLSAWNAGLARYLADPAGAAAALVLGTELTLEDYQLTQAGLRYWLPDESLAFLSGHPSPMQLSGDHLEMTLRDLGLLKNVVAWADLIDTAPASRLTLRGGAR